MWIIEKKHFLIKEWRSNRFWKRKRIYWWNSWNVSLSMTFYFWSCRRKCRLYLSSKRYGNFRAKTSNTTSHAPFGWWFLHNNRQNIDNIPSFDDHLPLYEEYKDLFFPQIVDKLMDISFQILRDENLGLWKMSQPQNLLLLIIHIFL